MEIPVPEPSDEAASTPSVSTWLEQRQAGDTAAAQPLWKRYFARLVTLAHQRLSPQPRQHSDAEDVALSAFHSFYDALAHGRYPVLAAHVSEAPRPLRACWPEVPADLEAVALRGLAKAPAQRFATVDALEAALRQCACAGQWTERQARAWWQMAGMTTTGDTMW